MATTGGYPLITPNQGYVYDMALLHETEIQEGLEDLDDWIVVNDSIERDFKFADFVAAIDFVNAVAKAAEEVGHHPDIDIRWNKVKLSLSTHSEGGLTAKDFALAETIDGLAQAG